MLTKTTKQLEEMLEVHSETGLTSEQVKERLEKNGYNELKKQKKKVCL